LKGQEDGEEDISNYWVAKDEENTYSGIWKKVQ